MMSTKLIRRALLAALATAVGGTAMLASGEAEARGGRRVEHWTYESRHALKGYEGFLFPGYYCSYRRFPVRTCKYDKHGREFCKITSWRLEQVCY
jgi:hypothetical protein